MNRNRRFPLAGYNKAGGAGPVINRQVQQTDLPSQQVRTPLPYLSAPAGDAPYPVENAGPYVSPPSYVVSTFDARPINGQDFTTFSGTNPADVFDNPDADPISLSTYYVVPPGFLAIIRKWSVNAICYYDPADPAAIIAPSGASQFAARIGFWIDGNPVNQHSWTNWELPFGTVEGDAYFVALPESTVELRLTALPFGEAPGQDGFLLQGLSKIYGNLLLTQGLDPTQEPGTHVAIPTFTQLLGG